MLRVHSEPHRVWIRLLIRFSIERSHKGSGGSSRSPRGLAIPLRDLLQVQSVLHPEWLSSRCHCLQGEDNCPQLVASHPGSDTTGSA